MFTGCCVRSSVSQPGYHTVSAVYFENFAFIEGVMLMIVGAVLASVFVHFNHLAISITQRIQVCGDLEL